MPQPFCPDRGVEHSEYPTRQTCIGYLLLNPGTSALLLTVYVKRTHPQRNNQVSSGVPRQFAVEHIRAALYQAKLQSH